MVPDTPDVERVLTGPDGVLDGTAAGRHRHRHEQHLAGGDAGAGRAGGGQQAARCSMRRSAAAKSARSTRTLSIMVGGDDAALARVRPILECMGNPERIIHVGAEPGSGQICKVCNQIAIGGALAGVSEAFAIARKAGVDPARVREALLGGFAVEPRARGPWRADDQGQLRARVPDAALSEGSSSRERSCRRARRRRSGDGASSRNWSTRSSPPAAAIWITRRSERCCSSWRDYVDATGENTFEPDLGLAGVESPKPFSAPGSASSRIEQTYSQGASSCSGLDGARPADTLTTAWPGLPHFTTCMVTSPAEACAQPCAVWQSRHERRRTDEARALRAATAQLPTRPTELDTPDRRILTRRARRPPTTSRG